MNSIIKRKIILADSIHLKGLDLLKKNKFEVVNATGADIEKLLGIASKYNAVVLIVRSTRKIDKPLIDRIKKETHLKLICTASSGYDNIDVEHAIKNGIKVFNVPKGNFISAAEHTFALILSISKNVITANNDMRKPVFDFTKYNNFELADKIIGIVGVGRVGSHVARIAKAFKMKILGCDIDKSLIAKYEWIKFVNLKNILLKSDILTIHTPLNETTLNMIGEKELKFMKKESVLINCARGGIINEASLIKALKNNQFKYAGLDVFVNEPHFNKEFSSLKNIILTPHLAGKTRESKERMSVQLAESIINYYNKKSSKR
ncbi:MAG: hydroxyacid dehydrogenase [Ignavibacteria bacterium]